jgi:hypothetical protein
MNTVERWAKQVPLSQVSVVEPETYALYGNKVFVANGPVILAMCKQMCLPYEDAMYEIENRLDRINVH